MALANRAVATIVDTLISEDDDEDDVTAEKKEKVSRKI